MPLPLKLALLLLPGALTILFISVALVLRRTGGYAPGWRLRCRACGRTRDAAEAGVVRWRALSIGKRIRAYCSGCDRVRWVCLERAPTDADASDD